MRVARREAAVHAAWAVGVACSSLLLGACSSRPGATIERAVSHQVERVMEGQGLPLEWDWVGCKGPNVKGVVRCFATTANSPTGAVTANIRLRGTRDAPCTGVLRVEMSGVLVKAERYDPCRGG